MNTTAARMNEIVKHIRKNGSADLVFNGETVTVGFQGSEHAVLTMLGGGYYTVTTLCGRKLPVAKGELVTVVITD
jgi:hypothetical protein